MLQDWEWLIIGALGSIAVFFLIFYFVKRDEKYNLLFALGCLVTIARMIFYARVNIMDAAGAGYRFVAAVNYLSFIWGPLLYAVLANSLFPAEGSRSVRRVLLAVALTISALIVLWPQGIAVYGAAFDYIILGFMLYAVYIYAQALLHKLPFSVPVFIANLLFVSGIVHDVLLGSHIISGSQGELFMFASLLYAIIIASVLAYRYTQSEKKRLEMQLKFLHAQIQPHFLYNTLGTISAYCQTDSQMAGELLNYLSTYLRGKFRDESGQLVCLNDELDLVKAYLTIEQARFKERIAVRYEIEDDCNILIPSLFLQPLVENAVKHGILPRKEGGEIVLSVKKRGGAVVIRVEDNGVGMDSQTLKDVLDGKAGGIGIRNTNERLLRHYNVRLEAESKPGEGSAFIITIPVS